MPNPDKVVAYFTMEIGLGDELPTYCGGLGMLAGDTVKAAADMGVPMAAVTLCYRKGFFRQTIDRQGRQKEHPVDWDPNAVLEEMPQRVHVPIEGRDVLVRAYRRMVRGVNDHYVPVYFLDTDLPENRASDRSITHWLYQGDDDERLRQRAVLGIAGPRMLRAMTHDADVYHLNEGHGFMVMLEKMSEHLSRFDKHEVDAACEHFARRQTVFTTHTPIPAGHDEFKVADVRRIIGDHPVLRRADICGTSKTLNATVFCLNLSRYANGVAKRHGEVSREMFPEHAKHIDAVTNGIHAGTWASEPFARLFDAYAPGWRADNTNLRLAAGIPDDELLAANAENKRAYADLVNARADTKIDPERFTITFARRAAPYKRGSLILHDMDRLLELNEICPLQLVFTGKAHPGDSKGKDIIQRIVRAGKEVKRRLPIAYVPDYDMAMGAASTAGSDIWLNNPEPPLEASGTSGMKAALNGVPSLSTLDGWWIEGHVENVTGWAIEDPRRGLTGEALVSHHAERAYDKLAKTILPLWRDDKEYWAEVMRSCIALNGPHFTTERMVKDYVLKAYAY